MSPGRALSYVVITRLLSLYLAAPVMEAGEPKCCESQGDRALHPLFTYWWLASNFETKTGSGASSVQRPTPDAVVTRSLGHLRNSLGNVG